MLDAELTDPLSRLVAGLGGELALMQPGSDVGVVPIYSLLGELCDLVRPDAEALKASNVALDRIGDVLDRGGLSKQDDIAFLIRYVEQLQCWLRYFEMGDVITWERLMELWLDDAGESAAEAEPADEAVVTEEEVSQAAEDELMVMDLVDSRDVLEEFYQEADEHLGNIEAALLDIEEDPEDPEPIRSMFRSFHTIKGVAGFLDLVPIRTLAHEIETLLDLIRSDRLAFTSDTVNLVLESRDRLYRLVQQVLTGLNEDRQPDVIVPVRDLIVRAQKVIASENSDAVGEEVVEASAEEDAFTFEEKSPVVNSVPNSEAPATPPAPAEPTAKAPVVEQAAASAPAVKKKVGATIRMNTDKLDSIIEAVGELVIVESQLLDSITESGAGDASRVENNLRQLSRITRELQNSSMSLRMVSLKPLFQRMQRLARDVAAKSGKFINFRVEGEDTEMDRTVVEQIGDPLVHMIRNSVDHGIEKPEDRRAAGKTEVGDVVLKASYVGEHIVLELKDDGGGISSEKVLAKAVSRGLAVEGQDYSREEIIQMIFLPGFSTAEQVSDFSGRGVGMDVVRSNVQKLRGRIEMTSVEGEGSHVKISLPLTMAIIDGLLIRCGDQRYVIPVSAINMTLKPADDQVFNVQSRGQVIKHRDRIFNLVRMADIFGIESDVTNPVDGIVIMIETGVLEYGLIVDEILHKQEVVIKQLGGSIGQSKGVSGGAILGDGTVALILDPSTMGEMAGNMGESARALSD